MKFDRFDDGAVATATEVLPDGDHVCEITGEKEWSAQDGSREAVIVTFTPVNGAPAFDKFLDPAQERDTKDARGLLAAIGLPADHDLGDGSLKGRRVTVTVKRAVDKAGEPKFDKRSGLQTLWVNGFKTAPQAPAKPAEPAQWQRNADEQAKRIAKKTASQKATAAMDDPDDVPF
jgi:hypothetical protein